MTGVTCGVCGEGGGDTAEQMEAMVAGLVAAGLVARVYKSRGMLEVTATLRPAGRREIEVIADGDGYVQVSWWAPPGATPGEVTASIGRVLAAITGPDRPLQ